MFLLLQEHEMWISRNISEINYENALLSVSIAHEAHTTLDSHIKNNVSSDRNVGILTKRIDENFNGIKDGREEAFFMAIIKQRQENPPEVDAYADVGGVSESNEGPALMDSIEVIEDPVVAFSRQKRAAFKSWTEYEIPWMTLSASDLEECQKGTKDPAVSKNVVDAVLSDMRFYDKKITAGTFRNITVKFIINYPNIAQKGTNAHRQIEYQG